MATWMIAILTLFLTIGGAASQEPAAGPSAVGGVASAPKKLEDRLISNDEDIAAALDNRDAVQKFDWLRRKRSEVQTLRPRQTAALSELDDQISQLQFELGQQIGERENIPGEIGEVERRDRLIAEIKTLEEEMSQLKEYDPDKEQQLSDKYQEIENLKNGYYGYIYYDVSITRDFLERKQSKLDNDVKQKQNQMAVLQPYRVQLASAIDDTTVYLDQLEDEMGLLLIPETAKNRFKLNMTLAFSSLVMIVIMGFFVLSWKDEIVRRAIFSGQSGIQFLTLFSLVIAIILFGILEILEGKELGGAASALTHS